MAIRLYDPGGEAPAHSASLAPRLTSLKGLRIGVLANGKVNGDVLARETARLFAERHGSVLVADENKHNATRICPPDLLGSLRQRCDFLITAVGD
jgi:hypothetical protein